MTTAPLSLQIPSPAAAAQALRVELTRRGDRYQTHLLLVEGGEEIPLLRSIEAGGSERWPPSPVIQELLRHEGATGPFLAGVGMAGNSHWSLAINATASAIVLDVACRLKQTPLQLGSCYERMNGRLEGAGDDVGELIWGGTLLRCQLLPSATVARLEVTPSQLAIRPQLDPAFELPQTVRWKYGFSLAEKPPGGLLQKSARLEKIGDSS